MAKKHNVLEPWRIKISDANLAAGTTPWNIAQKGIESYHEYGFIVIENAIPAEIVDKFHDRLLGDVERKLNAGSVVYDQGNQTDFSLSPPLSEDWLHEEVWANKHAVTVIESIIGPKPQLTFASSNVNLPLAKGATGILREAVHTDPYGMTHSFPTAVEAFMFTRDCDATNGSTEIWPGSHKNFRGKIDQNDNGRGWIKKEVFTERARIAPPIQPFIPKGSICLRDLRIWHAGMPNYSSDPRVMLIFLYYPRWFRCHMRINLPESACAKATSFERYDLIGGTNFLPGVINNVDDDRNVLSLNFTQDPELTISAQRKAIDFLASRKDSVIPVTEDDFWTSPDDTGSAPPKAAGGRKKPRLSGNTESTPTKAAESRKKPSLPDDTGSFPSKAAESRKRPRSPEDIGNPPFKEAESRKRPRLLDDTSSSPPKTAESQRRPRSPDDIGSSPSKEAESRKGPRLLDDTGTSVPKAAERRKRPRSPDSTGGPLTEAAESRKRPKRSRY